MWTVSLASMMPMVSIAGMVSVVSMVMLAGMASIVMLMSVVSMKPQPPQSLIMVEESTKPSLSLKLAPKPDRTTKPMPKPFCNLNDSEAVAIQV